MDNVLPPIAADAPAVNSQIIYKLGEIGSQVKSLSDNLNSAVLGLREQIEASDKRKDIEFSLYKIRLDKVEAKIEALDEWRRVLFTKLGFIISAISVFWLIFAEQLKTTAESLIG